MPWSKLVDLELDDDDKLDAMPIFDRKPDYPYGTKICLCSPELRKLRLEADCNVGDVIDMRCFGEVTSIAKDGDSCRVEIQIQKIAVEDEMGEGMGD